MIFNGIVWLYEILTQVQSRRRLIRQGTKSAKLDTACT